MISITFEYQDEFNEAKTITVSDSVFGNTQTQNAFAIMQLRWAFERLMDQISPTY